MSLKRTIEVTKQPRKIGRFIKNELLGIVGTRDFRPFIVLTKGRTGSNLLISMLDSHPNIRAEAEIFRDLSPRIHGLALRMVFSKQPRHIRARGFKIFYRHTLKGGSDGIWDKLERMDDLHVIHLKRRNILRAMVSARIARAQGVWLARSDNPRMEQTKNVSFSADELVRGFATTRSREEEGEKRFGAHALMTLYYEDLISDREGVFAKLTEFLNVPYVSPETNLRKQNPERLKDLIVNYDELKSGFIGTEWYQFFED